MQIRKAEIDDTGKLISLWKSVFNDDDNFIIKFFRDRFKHANTLLAEDNGRIIAALHVIDCELLTPDGVYPTAYIVGAGTVLDRRNQGIMTAMLKQCTENNACVTLFPAKREFYEKQGFATVSRVNCYRLGRRCDTAPDAVKPDVEGLNEAYNMMIMQAGGGISRDSLAWRFLFDEEKTVCVRSDAGLAYAVIRNATAVETAASDAQSAELLLDRLAADGITKVHAASGTYVDALLAGAECQSVEMGMSYPPLPYNVYIAEQY